jgi:hypothetical protein
MDEKKYISLSAAEMDNRLKQIPGINAQLTQIFYQPIIEVTDNRIISLSDIFNRLHFNSESNLTCTIPDDTTIATTIGSEFTVVRAGNGNVTFVAGTGVTLKSIDGMLSISKDGGVIAYKESANTWRLIGAQE